MSNWRFLSLSAVKKSAVKKWVGAVLVSCVLFLMAPPAAIALNYKLLHGNCTLNQDTPQRCIFTYFESPWELRRSYAVDDVRYFVNRTRPYNLEKWTTHYGKQLANQTESDLPGNDSLCTDTFTCTTPDWSIQFTPDKCQPNQQDCES